MYNLGVSLKKRKKFIRDKVKIIKMVFQFKKCQSNISVVGLNLPAYQRITQWRKITINATVFQWKHWGLHKNFLKVKENIKVCADQVVNMMIGKTLNAICQGNEREPVVILVDSRFGDYIIQIISAPFVVKLSFREYTGSICTLNF